MSSIIIYASKYGSSKKYALEFSKRENIEAISYKDIKTFEGFDTIIYFGGVYASKVLGLKETLEKHKVNYNQNLIIVTVGLTDPIDLESMNSFYQSLKKQIPSLLFDDCKIVNLMGSLKFSDLNFILRFFLKRILNKANQKDNGKKLNTNKDEINYIDFDSLEKVKKLL